MVIDLNLCVLFGLVLVIGVVIIHVHVVSVVIAMTLIAYQKLPVLSSLVSILLVMTSILTSIRNCFLNNSILWCCILNFA